MTKGNVNSETASKSMDFCYSVQIPNAYQWYKIGNEYQKTDTLMLRYNWS